MKSNVLRRYRGYDGYNVSVVTGLRCEDPSLAVQSQKEESDINFVMRQFGVTGRVKVSVKAPSYGDFTGVGDYRSAIEAVRSAEESFMAMPAEVRDRFGNDPQRFLEFCSLDSSRDEMKKLGLLRPDPVPPAGTPES